MLEHIYENDRLLCLIIRANYSADDIEFFTPNDFSQQLGYMKRSSGYVIPPHVHNSVPREVQYTKEVLFIKTGKLRVDFYNDEQEYLESRILSRGDVILLAYGGHGFEMIEDSEIIEANKVHMLVRMTKLVLNLLKKIN